MNVNADNVKFNERVGFTWGNGNRSVLRVTGWDLFTVRGYNLNGQYETHYVTSILAATSFDR